MQAFSNPSALAAQLVNTKCSFEIVSFDVFDTLIERRLAHPDLAKVPAAKALAHLLGHGGSIDHVKRVFEQRLKIEAHLREASSAKGLDPECKIEDVFSSWLTQVGLEPTDNSIHALLCAERDAELIVARPGHGMLQLMQALSEAKIRLIYTSDTYLPRWMVDEILATCGFGKSFERGYVSCENGAAKYSGKLFKHILRAEGIEASQLTHVGDDKVADIEGAALAGVATKWYLNKQRKVQHATQQQVRKALDMNSFWAGAQWNSLCIAHPKHVAGCELDDLYRLGYKYLGPLFTNYVHQVMNRATEDGIELLLFCSREGFLLERLYSRMSAATHLQNSPKAVYSYLNRKSVFTASLHEIRDRELETGFDTTSPTLRNLFKRFSLPVKELVVLALRSGFDSVDQDIADPRNHPKLKNLLNHPDFLAAVERARLESSELLTDYLEQVGFWRCKKVALVDVGWNGTTQQALAIATRDNPHCPEIWGYYMALLGRLKLGPVPNCELHGIYFDYRRQTNGISMSRYVELFETACRAPHPSVTGFKRETDGIVVPTFEDINSVERQLEQQDDGWVASIQSGILDYCDDYVDTLSFHYTTPEAEADFALFRIDRLLRYPTKEEAQLLTRFSHSEGFGQSMVHVPKSRSNQELKTPSNSIRYKHRTLWREGRYAQSKIPGSNILLNGFRLLKSRRY